MAKVLVIFVVVASLVALASASDADPINDYCVADLASKITINGLACKAASSAMSEDFAFRGFRKDGDTNNPLGIALAPGFAGINYPGLNTLGFALAKFNYAKGGLVPPHTHPRAAEVIYVVKGEVHVGFVDTAGKLFATSLKRGDFFVFPKGLVHFQLNVGSGHAVTISVLNGQNPGVQFFTAVFAAQPSIDTSALARAFQLKDMDVMDLQTKFKPAA
ncbi:germin-like protein subfamily 2 member 1 [Physcomitrium patens]|uniref:Germin-like protein n=1 Tax=Physcomitrium patens TaxID=3218 RepID=A9SIF1_PHYPA|nr:germin-like protein subfamily 2 member 1 [Physcomitrium patens]PNR28844.1 hypothetical protein PHYPA_027536 [Physcomitrium patens]|eukprot:XP_024361734.1 germin-like protein subfamily 2 member 1 [Physcomitrella patens]